jgi:hypothetical protein
MAASNEPDEPTGPTEPDEPADSTEPIAATEPTDESDPKGPDMTATTLNRLANLPMAPVPTAALTLIDRSSAGLLQGCAARSAAERYVAAHLAALRSAAAVLSVRGRSSRGGPRSVWDLLPRVAPELTEWAAFFAATATRRAAIETGRSETVTPREADDLLREAEAFQHAVESVLGLPQYPVLPDALPSCT